MKNIDIFVKYKYDVTNVTHDVTHHQVMGHGPCFFLV